MSLGWRRRRNGRSCDLMAIDFAAVFRVLVTLFGITALLSAIVGLVSFFAGGAELLLGVALVSAILSLAGSGSRHELLADTHGTASHWSHRGSSSACSDPSPLFSCCSSGTPCGG